MSDPRIREGLRAELEANPLKTLLRAVRDWVDEGTPEGTLAAWLAEAGEYYCFQSPLEKRLPQLLLAAREEGRRDREGEVVALRQALEQFTVAFEFEEKRAGPDAKWSLGYWKNDEFHPMGVFHPVIAYTPENVAELRSPALPAVAGGGAEQ